MFKNIVYKFTFTKRKEKHELSFCYIGSKSKCYIKDNKIYDSNHKIYKTSSTVDLVKTLIDEGDYELEILFESDTYDDIINKENKFQIEADVVHNDEYFNLSYACKNIFTSPDYVTVKTDNIDIPYKRISKNHFESGDYCGTTSGMKWYHNPIDNKNYVLENDSELITDLNLKIGRSEEQTLYGKDNPFYGKKHSDESKKKIIASRNKFYEENPEYCEQIKNNQINNMKKVSQLPKSEKFLKQLKDRMTTTLYITNVETGESKRISKDDYQEYNANGWITHVTHANKLNKLTANDITCLYCGFTSKENNSSFHKWHNDNCKKNPINADKWSSWLDVKDDKYKYYMYSKYDIIYELYQANKALSGKKLLPLIKNEIIDRELTDSEYLFFKRMINKIKKDNFIPLGSES